MSKNEFLDPLETKKFKKQKRKQFCWTPCILRYCVWCQYRMFWGILLYWCHIVGGNLEQNIVGVTLVVQNFFEIFCIDFVGLSGSPCILKLYKTRTEWAISAHYLTDMGFSNVIHNHTRVEILQYLRKSCG